jgi:hypothetical protein
MHPQPTDITDQEWDEAGKLVLKQIRDEKGIANWLPTFLNGRSEFQKRVLTLILNNRRQREDHHHG